MNANYQLDELAGQQADDLRETSGEICDGFITVAGARIHCLRAGSGRPLVLLHGLVGSARNWHRNIPGLAHYATVYAIDNLNMGQSDRIPGLDASLEATADRVAAAMDTLGIPTADIAAHSHGGAVAMMLAARHPGRVRKLILFAPANPFCDLGRRLIRFYTTPLGCWFAHQLPGMPRIVKSAALGRMYGKPSRITGEALDGYTLGTDIPGTVDHILSIVRGWRIGMTHLYKVLDRLADTPTLLVWGDRDRAVGLDSARALQGFLTRSQLVVIPGVGHIAFEEVPDIANSLMTDWIADARPASSAAA